jgi:hypothetical protein
MADEAKTADIQRDADAPEQPNDSQANLPEETVDLLGIIEDEFGMARSRIRMEAATGNVSIDGERWLDAIEKDFRLPRSQVVGKTVEVKGTARTFRFQVQ